MSELAMHPDRLFPPDDRSRGIARELHGHVSGLPLVCPHGHVDPAVLARDEPFPDPVALLVVRDHYLLRLLYSHGVRLEDLGVPAVDGSATEADPRAVWRRVAEHWPAFRGTPTKLWFEQVLHDVFGVRRALTPDSADDVYDHVAERLTRDDHRPRALFQQFGVEVLATTDSPLSSLEDHRAIADSPWPGRVVPTFRPDALVQLDNPGWPAAVARLSELTGCDTGSYAGFLDALVERRAAFRALGATATDHGHATADTTPLTGPEAEAAYQRGLRGAADACDSGAFAAHMLGEFARMSVADGMVMQLHAGVLRDHNRPLFARFGHDIGGDMPRAADFVHGLRPLLERHGNDPRLTLVLFTLDESTYSRELAPLAGHYPSVRLGPAWWFHDSPDGMRRFRELTTETAGFRNTVGFNDDTRAFPSIPVRHDVARRVDCAYLARLVGEHRLTMDEAVETAVDLAYRLPKEAYRL